jgi:glycine/D-amino acid oxidase-like deaminating enzyme
MVSLSGCDTDLKSGQDPLDGDFLWFSLRKDGFLVMGFGGCFGEFTEAMTQKTIKAMVGEVKQELYTRFPTLKEFGYRIKPKIGGLNTASNLLPIVGNLDHQENVWAIAAQSGVGLLQSMVAAKSVVDRMAGDEATFVQLSRLQTGQVPFPETNSLRVLALKLGSKYPIAREVGAPVLRAAGSLGFI